MSDPLPNDQQLPTDVDFIFRQLSFTYPHLSLDRIAQESLGVKWGEVVRIPDTEVQRVRALLRPFVGKLFCTRTVPVCHPLATSDDSPHPLYHWFTDELIDDLDTRDVLRRSQFTPILFGRPKVDQLLPFEKVLTRRVGVGSAFRPCRVYLAVPGVFRRIQSEDIAIACLLRGSPSWEEQVGPSGEHPGLAILDDEAKEAERLGNSPEALRHHLNSSFTGTRLHLAVRRLCAKDRALNRVVPLWFTVARNPMEPHAIYKQGLSVLASYYGGCRTVKELLELHDYFVAEVMPRGFAGYEIW
jgi:hypothetical protein